MAKAKKDEKDKKFEEHLESLENSVSHGSALLEPVATDVSANVM